MSDTPKYTYWYLSEEEQARIARERAEEERRREELRLQEAERRREERVARMRQVLTEENAQLFLKLKQLSEYMDAWRFRGGEQIPVLREALTPLQDSIDAARWDEDVERAAKNLKIKKLTADALLSFFHEKQNIIQSLEKVREGLASRGNLQGCSASLLTEQERISLAESVRDADSPEGLKILKNTWKTASEQFEHQFLLYDQQERFARLASGLAALDRQFISGDKLVLYQQISAEITRLKAFIEKENTSSAASSLLKAEDCFQTLSLKLQNDVEALEFRREENASRLSELSEAFEETASQILNFGLNSEVKPVDFSDVENRIRLSLKRLETLCTRENTENFALAADSIRKETEAYETSVRNAVRLAEFQSSHIARLPEILWQELASHENLEIRTQCKTLEKQLQNRQCPHFEAEFEKLSDFTDTVLARIAPQAELWNARKNSVQNVLNSECDYLASYGNDAVAQRWAQTELSQQRQFLREAEATLQEGNLQEAENALTQWRERMGKIAAAVNLMQEKELRRQYLVQRFQEKFRELGFTPGVPQLEDPANPASGLILTADRPEGRTVNVRFDQNEREPVMYAVDGFPMPVQKADGKQYRTCDEAQRQLEILHKLLEKHGILMGKIRWEDQPPVDLAKEAMELPDTADRSLYND